MASSEAKTLSGPEHAGFSWRATALRPVTISPIFKCGIGFVLLPNDQILEFINARSQAGPGRAANYCCAQ